MNKGKSKRTKDDPCHFSSHVAFRLCLFLCILHPSSFTPDPFLFPSRRNASSQVRDLAEDLPYWANKYFSMLFSSCFSPPCSSLRTTGQSHLALSKRRVSYGGDSQARCLSGAAIRRSHLHPAHTLFMNTVGLFSGFNSRRDE